MPIPNRITAKVNQFGHETAGVNFEGVNSVITCGTSDNLLLNSTPMTISAWIRLTGLGESNNGRIIDKGSGITGVSLSMSAGNNIVFRANGTTELVRTSTLASIVTGKWVNVIATWDGSLTATNVRLFVKGTECAYGSTTNQVAPISNTGNSTRIGNESGGTRTFDGAIGEVAIWNSVLSDADIAILGKSRVKGTPLKIRRPNLMLYVPLDDHPPKIKAGSRLFRDLSINTFTCRGSGSQFDFRMVNGFGFPLRDEKNIRKTYIFNRPNVAKADNNFVFIRVNVPVVSVVDETHKNVFPSLAFIRFRTNVPTITITNPSGINKIIGARSTVTKYIREHSEAPA